jgi:transcriptional regulator with XRE-family HTH domain
MQFMVAYKSKFMVYTIGCLGITSCFLCRKRSGENMNEKTFQGNRIKELRIDKDMTSRTLAKLIGTSAPHMTRLESGKTPLSLGWIRKIADALAVSPNDIVDLRLGKKITDDCDEALLASALEWLMEGAEKSKLRLPRQELSHWTSYVYKHAIEDALNFKQTRFLAVTIIRVIRRTKSKT